MREIKFRGWDEKNKEMVYNINLLFSNHLNECFEEYEECGLKIMQYTGLKDKNGVEIYEGDIVKWGHLNQWSREQPHRIAEVKFDPDIQFHSQVGVFNFGSFAYRDTTETDLEVIGNIYENPELLEEEE